MSNVHTLRSGRLQHLQIHFRAFIADESDEEFEIAIQEAIQNSLAAAETDNATANL